MFFLSKIKICRQKRKNIPFNSLQQSNSETLRTFFLELISDDLVYLDRFEEQITDVKDKVTHDKQHDYLDNIIAFRKQLLNLKHYYCQQQSIFDGLLENEKSYFDDETLRRLTIVHNRIDHLQLGILNLRNYVTLMRETYQVQIDIEQNKLIIISTLITATFCH